LRRKKWQKRNKKVTPPKAAEKKQVAPKVKQFGKNKEPRTIARKGAKFYPVYDLPRPLPSNKHRHRPTKLRQSLTPGTIVINVAGRYRGKRCVFLRQLKSGLLLVTGPFKLNGIPLRRVNQAYVIATSTKLDLSGVNIPDKFNDEFFRRPAKAKKTKSEADFFAEGEQPKKKKQLKEVNPEKVKDQKEFDEQLVKLVKSQPLLKQYLHSRFSLHNHEHPHLLKF